MTISDLCWESLDTARQKGFEPDSNTLPTKERIALKLALIHSEVSEALEAIRNDSGLGNLGEELADVVIRTCQLAQTLNIELEFMIIDKMKKNRDRPYKHGGKAF